MRSEAEIRGLVNTMKLALTFPGYIPAYAELMMETTIKHLEWALGSHEIDSILDNLRAGVATERVKKEGGDEA